MPGHSRRPEVVAVAAAFAAGVGATFAGVAVGAGRDFASFAGAPATVVVVVARQGLQIGEPASGRGSSRPLGQTRRQTDRWGPRLASCYLLH